MWDPHNYDVFIGWNAMELLKKKEEWISTFTNMERCPCYTCSLQKTSMRVCVIEICRRILSKILRVVTSS